MAEHYNIGEKALVWAGGVALAVLVSAGVASCNDPEPPPPTPAVELRKADLCLDPTIGPYTNWCPQFDPAATAEPTVPETVPPQPPIENYDVPDVDLDRPGDGGDGIDINWCRRWWC